MIKSFISQIGSTFNQSVIVLTLFISLFLGILNNEFFITISFLIVFYFLQKNVQNLLNIKLYQKKNIKNNKIYYGSLALILLDPQDIILHSSEVFSIPENVIDSQSWLNLYLRF